MIKWFCDGCGTELIRNHANKLHARINKGENNCHVTDIHACNKGCLVAAISKQVPAVKDRL